MTAIWKIQSKISAASAAKRRQSIIIAILKNRGLISKKDQQQFLNPPHPSTIKAVSLGIKSSQLKKAIRRIKAAIADQALIYIYGDFDADGISSAAILWETLNHLGAKVMPYIPVRGSQTRGLSRQGIDEIINLSAKTHQLKPQLIITVDNGISAFKGCQYAKKQGIDVIISDHHQPKRGNNRAAFPEALAIVHTTKLAGAGVAWFFAQEILKDLSSTLELAALGTIADMVPLTEANRSLAKYGLEQLRRTKRVGIKALARNASVDLATITPHEVSFRIAPRLNAMGRLKHGLDSLRLLCTLNRSRAQQLSQDLAQVNQLRHDLSEEMFDHARKQWLKQADRNPKLIFIAHSSYHEGIVGLVAGRLAEKFNRPAIVVAQGKTQSKASARSIKGFNMIKALRQIEALLLELGGHELAAGFTAKTKKLSLIQKQLEKLADRQLKSNQLQPELKIDCLIDFKDITWILFNELEKLQPFGFANPQPVFATRGVKIVNFRPVGQGNQHLKLRLSSATWNLEPIDAIAFNFGRLSPQLSRNQLVDIVYTIESNHWNHRKSLQLKIKDVSLQPR